MFADDMGRSIYLLPVERRASFAAVDWVKDVL